MPATFINAALVLLGSLLGMLFKDHIGARFHSILTHALGLCVLGIGISSAVGTEKYDILISKGVIDGVTAITFASAMGLGVAFSVVPLLLYQGGLTLLFSCVGPFLDPAAITEMSAVGGTIIMGIAVNMLGLGKGKIRVGNMLPAIFLPLLYLPVESLLSSLPI